VENELAGQESFGEGGLERSLGRPRQEWSVEDLAHLFRRGQARGLSLMHVGGDGWLKRLDFMPPDESRLRRVCEAGERADGSSLFPGSGIPTGASDIVLRPRIESGFLDPFSAVPTLVLMCSHAGPDGEPLPQSPDTIVRRAMDRLRQKTGVELLALGEVEYFLGKRRDESDIYGADDRGYHSVSPFVFGEPLRRRALELLVDLGLNVKYGHSEVGYIEAREPDGVIWEQHEIELGLDTLPRAAEAILLTQWVLRNLAHQSGMRCSTDPIMAEGHAGNGLHFHLAPSRDGELTAVREPGGSLSDPARWLIGGLVQTGAALMAFGNRAPGSLTRLTQAKEAPNRITWGEYDRSALIRLPAQAMDSVGRPVSPATIEFRLPDGSVFPHLLLAGAALAMIKGAETEGLDDLLEATSATTVKDGGGRATSVPWSFREVAAAVAEHREALEADGVFPSALLDRLVADLSHI
jgi:glutamine synthetase